MYMYLIVFSIGLIIGSFLNVCIYRIPLEQSIVLPSSHCFHCNTPLNTWDLIPVFSFIFLKGECRYCSTKISPRYLVVEILTGIIFLLLFLKFGLSMEYFFFLILLCILICITFIDYDYKIIPDEFILLGFGYGLIYRLIMY
ncbi:MAG: prepilin peptidase, partial [Clostridiales bacterium]|nr:prepilin peptidase [Clostridiales bacterium]